MATELSPYLRGQIAKGQAILFLGAGASIGGLDSEGRPPLTGDQLRDQLSDVFLGGQMKDAPLARVAAIAREQAGENAFRGKVRECFAGLVPAVFHQKIADFKWRAIVTTNFDTIVEEAYRLNERRIQDLGIVLREGGELEAESRKGALPLLKIHGCVTAIRDQSLPLILASEEYAMYRENRQYLFQTIGEWGRTYPIVFVGYDISDPHIFQLLFRLSDDSISRPRFALVRPNIEQVEVNYWESKRVDVFSLTFEQFLTLAERSIPQNERILSKFLDPESLPYNLYLKNGTEVSADLAEYLSTQWQFVDPDSTFE
ncbi:MAG: SIR2 family protein, partial [Pseudomonadota bacterium]